MTRASELVLQLQELAKRGRIFPPHLPKSGKEITADQLPVFGDRALFPTLHDERRRPRGAYTTHRPPRSAMNSRRLMGFIPLAENHFPVSLMRFSDESYALHRSTTGGLMSHKGHQRRFSHVGDVSACPPIPDVTMSFPNGRNGPLSDSCTAANFAVQDGFS